MLCNHLLYLAYCLSSLLDFILPLNPPMLGWLGNSKSLASLVFIASILIVILQELEFHFSQIRPSLALSRRGIALCAWRIFTSTLSVASLSSKGWWESAVLQQDELPEETLDAMTPDIMHVLVQYRFMGIE